MQFDFKAPHERREFVELAHNPAVRRMFEMFLTAREADLKEALCAEADEIELRWRQGRLQELKDWAEELENARKDT